MDYSIYKDDNVVSTVDKIIKILNSLGIELKEEWYGANIISNFMPNNSCNQSNCEFRPYSLRLFLFDMYNIGSNGKGTTKENAKASAYAEFMERLQNQSLPYECLMLYSDKFSFAPDEKEYDEEVKEFISKYKYKKILSFCQLDKFDGFSFKDICIPFYNVKENKLNYFPPLHFIFCTNGMASGNTPEEALVQGFSEICERYSYNQVILESIAMPEIPKKYYEQYERIKGLIEYSKQQGWEVYIKDASLGQGIPAICTIFENKEKGIFTFKFGSQPSLPIAIERTITEFFQGDIPNNSNLTNNFFQISDYSKKGLKYILSTLISNNHFFRISDKMHNIFFNKNHDYKFFASTWVDENKKYTNKELLKFLVDKITNITNNDILVRDVSFLGFPSYHIFIPHFSEIIYYDNDRLNLRCWNDYPNKKETVPDDIGSLISAILYKLKYEPQLSEILPHIPDEYLLILCYIVKKDYKNIFKYCEAILKIKGPPDIEIFISENRNLINLIYQYFKLKQEKEKPTVINNIINNMYEKNVIQKFNELIKNLDFEYIKNLFAETKERQIMLENQSKSQEEVDTKNKLKNIKQLLIQKYIENTPDQMKLAEVFDFSSLE